MYTVLHRCSVCSARCVECRTPAHSGAWVSNDGAQPAQRLISLAHSASLRWALFVALYLVTCRAIPVTRMTCCGQPTYCRLGQLTKWLVERSDRRMRSHVRLSRSLDKRSGDNVRSPSAISWDIVTFDNSVIICTFLNRVLEHTTSPHARCNTNYKIAT